MGIRLFVIVLYGVRYRATVARLRVYLGLLEDDIYNTT
jgi:hypothetical protein